MIQHIFFDLDHTLWDFERNSEICLREIHTKQIAGLVPYDDFLSTFRVINKILWRKLESNTITHDELRRTRFKDTLLALHVSCSDETSLLLNEHFMELLPAQRHLVEGATEILDYLFPKYPLHIISNGYLAVQTRKMEVSGLLPYFQKIITSDVSGARKPDRKIFDFALQSVGITAREAVYIGDDDIADKTGSLNAGLPFIHLDPGADHLSPSVVQNLTALKDLL